jgi:GTPase SAR1 family protein
LGGNHEAGQTVFVDKLLSQGGGKFASKKAEIGIDFFLINFLISKNDIGLKKDLKIVAQLWDYSTDREFREILPYYLSGSQGGIVIANASKEDSVQNTLTWLEQFWKYGEKNCPLVILGDTTDLLAKGQELPLFKELKEFLSEEKQYGCNIDYYEKSIIEMTPEEVRKILESLIIKIINLG